MTDDCQRELAGSVNHSADQGTVAVASAEPLPDGDPEIADGEWPNVDDEGQPISSTDRGGAA